MASTFNADTTPLPVCPEDGNLEDCTAAIKVEILKQLAPVKHRADHLVTVLRIRRSFFDGPPPPKLDQVIDKWLDHAYDTDKYGLPCWNMLIAAVADVNGGANRALAKKLAGIYKNGVYSTESSRLQPSMGKPEEETLERDISPGPSNKPHNISPGPVNNTPSQNTVPITKPLAESSGDEASTTSAPKYYYPSGTSSSSSSAIPSSIEKAIHSSSSSSSSNSTINVHSGVTCSETSSTESNIPSNTTGTNAPTGIYAPTGINAPTGTNVPSGINAPTGISSYGVPTGTTDNSDYSASTGTSSNNSSYGASTGTSCPTANSSYGAPTGTSSSTAGTTAVSSYPTGSSTGTSSCGASTGTSEGGLTPSVVDHNQPSPRHGYLSNDEQDNQQEEELDYQSSAMVTSSVSEYNEKHYETESDVAEDGGGNNSFTSGIKKKVSSILKHHPSPLMSYPMAKGHHGYALIINNIHIDGREERQGAEHDGKSLSEALTTLGYKLVYDKVHVNCNAYAIEDLFKRCMNIDHTHYDSFICCILSHGDSEFIYGSDDRKVYLKNLHEQASQCSTLVGKPKVFFVQACRGGMLPDARRVQVDDEGVQVGKILLPEACDVFFGYATSPNTKACRFTNAGSWYIIELCKAMKQFPHEDLMTIVQIAHYNVSTGKDYEYTREEQGKIKTYRQSPQLVSTLIKKLYFK